MSQKEFKAKMYVIHSSNIARVGFQYDYQKKYGVMRVEFHRGNIYQYWPVEKEKFSEIFKAESPGSWFQNEIVKNKELQFEKIN